MAVIPKVERSAWRRKQYFEISGYVRDREGLRNVSTGGTKSIFRYKKDKQQYPEDTGLRKKLKKYLIEGKNPGIGVGIIENIYKLI